MALPSRFYHGIGGLQATTKQEAKLDVVGYGEAEPVAQMLDVCPHRLDAGMRAAVPKEAIKGGQRVRGGVPCRSEPIGNEAADAPQANRCCETIQ